jgi:hypothetical protein
MPEPWVGCGTNTKRGPPFYAASGKVANRGTVLTSAVSFCYERNSSS